MTLFGDAELLKKQLLLAIENEYVHSPEVGT